MHSRNPGGYIFYLFWLVIITSLVFAVVHWLKLPEGHMIDWIAGTVSVWWLIVITTLPWNVHFEARGVLAEAEHSRRIGIKIENAQEDYLRMLARRALWIALALHALSAVALFLLSYFKITPVGYVAAGFAILLTALRPGWRAYDYLWKKLSDLKQTFKYPREDVQELRGRVHTLEHELKELRLAADPANPGSAAWHREQVTQELKERINLVADKQDRMQEENRTNAATSIARGVARGAGGKAIDLYLHLSPHKRVPRGKGPKQG